MNGRPAIGSTDDGAWLPSQPTIAEIALGVGWFVLFPRGYFVARLGPRGLLLFIAALTAVHFVAGTGWRAPTLRGRTRDA